MNEMEVAEMIEQHIDYLHRGQGRQRALGASADAVRAAFHAAGRWRAADRGCDRHGAASSWRMASLLAPEGLDRLRGIQFIIPDELRAVIPQRQDCTPERVKAAMEFLCDEWLVDVATDYAGKAPSSPPRSP